MDFSKQRKKIERIDHKIVKLLEERFSIVGAIGLIKKEKNIKIIDSKREQELLERISQSSTLSPDFIKKLYKLIFNQSYKLQ